MYIANYYDQFLKRTIHLNKVHDMAVQTVYSLAFERGNSQSLIVRGQPLRFSQESWEKSVQVVSHCTHLGSNSRGAETWRGELVEIGGAVVSRSASLVDR